MRRLLALLCLIFPLLAPSKGPKAAMDSFRYEVYSEGTCAVYYLHKTADGTSLYYRDAGSLEGWRLSSIDDGALDDISKIWKKLKLASYDRTPLDSEDKARDRWVVEAGFGPDSSHSIIEYLDSPRSEEDLKIQEAVVSCIHTILERHRSSDRRCNSSKCVYSPDGTLLKRIDFNAEGQVCGGYDALDPFATF